MASECTSNEEFFVQLASLIEHIQQKGHGSVFLTQKRLDENSSAPSDFEATKPTAILVRASDGKTQSKDRVKNKQHVKISTIVQPDGLEAFFARYAEKCKAGMQSLKKRDRSRRKKDKTKKKKVADVKS